MASRAGWRWPAAVTMAALALWLIPIAGGEPLRIRVTPTVAQPPAVVTVRADVEAHDDNRSLEITAESDHFFTSSRVPLEGRRGPRFSEVHFDNLPQGTYTVKVILMGPLGQRAAETRSVIVGAADDTPL